MNVLSLFDGMSCLRIALERAGLEVTNYFASEIDKYAIQVSKANWPDIKHIGDVTKVEAYMLPKIDLLAGGSPCQGFSFAGKQLNFNDPRSALFFEFVRLLKECKPRWFLLENVLMKKEYQDVISEALGVKPIMINSALVSAQNRKRLYWTNIPKFGQPKDRGIVLKDILEKSNQQDLLLSEKDIARAQTAYAAKTWKTGNSMGAMKFPNDLNGKAKTLVTSQAKGARETNHISCIQTGLADDIKGFDANRRIYSAEGKAPTLISSTGGHKAPKVNIEAITEQIKAEVSRDFGVNLLDNGNIRPYQKDARKSGLSEIGIICSQENKCVTHIASHVPKMHNGITYRKLTPVECERLQTVEDNYSKSVSNTQRYKMLGNGWNIETIVHLLNPLHIADLI